MRRHLQLLIAAIVITPLALVASCPKKGGGGGDDPCENFTGVCLDITAHVTEAGTGASAKQATEADLIGGVAAQGRAGDYILQNDKIRVVVQGANRSAGISPWGGNILDADIVRGAGEEDADGFDELFFLINFGRTLKVNEVKVFRDGSEGGSAVLAVAGTDTLNDILNVPYLLENALGALGKVWVDPDLDMDLNITTFYILDPGATKVRMVTVFRNDSAAAYPLFVVEQFARGGYATLFNPARNSGGRFGYPDLVPEAADLYLAHVTPETAYGWLPVDVFGERGLPNMAMTISGTTSVLLGGESLFDFTGTERPATLPSGAVELQPGEQDVIIRDFVVARDLAGVTAEYEANLGSSLGQVNGTVTIPGGIPANTRVSVLDGSLPVSGFMVESDGTFSGRLAAGSYTLQVDAPGFPYSNTVDLTVAGGDTLTPALTVAETATVTVNARDRAGNLMPGKVTLICPAACPKPLRSTGRRFRDVDYDGWPLNVQHIGWIPATGTLTFQVPPGDYQVVVSRGIEYSTFPADWPTGQHTITAAVGTPVTVEAELDRVIDTTGWISSDLHVHGVNSPDAPILHLDRVASMVAENVEIMVATDHDFITDWAPYVTQAGADGVMKTIVGQEMTTFDWGHVNAFPLFEDPAEVQGGALDWGNGEAETHSPGTVFQLLKDMPGPTEKVVQLNHPRGGLGYFTSIGMDFATGKTATDPAYLHMSTSIVNGDDTGLFDDGFTAMEILNGRSFGDFAPRFADWIALHQRGLARTATAVSDTHKAYAGDMGNPLTYVAVTPATETPQTFDEAEFIANLNAGRAIGTTGPFVGLTASNPAGDTTGVGGTLTLAAPGDAVTLSVEVQIPTWMTFDAIEVYSNIDGFDAVPYAQMADLPTPTFTATVDLSTETPVLGAGISDPAAPHRRYVISRTFTANPTADAWYVVVVRGAAATGFPVILDESPPIAFTNALFVDADGGGYTAPKTFESGPRRPGARHLPPWQLTGKEPSEAEKIERLRHFAHTH
ncbi:MAG: CehA/McbA family metallohydrolase [Deltaproteobacteria bacterium]|nr:CehA/McbA family metallohydrolase [Deltaproteobacteria bacterium]